MNPVPWNSCCSRHPAVRCDADGGFYQLGHSGGSEEPYLATAIYDEVWGIQDLLF